MPAEITAAKLITSLFISLVVSAANMALSAILAEDAPQPEQEGARGHLVNVTDTQAPLPLLYGRCRVGINRVYVGVSGSDNKHLHIVGVVGEGEVNGIAQTGGVDQIFLNDKLYTEYGSLVYYEFFTGTATQNVCATLHSAIPEWTDPLRHTAYIYMRLEYDPDKFQNLPAITLEVEGLKVYNPDTGITAYTTNPALCSRDLITRSSKRGGIGISSSRLNDTSVIDTASYCATKGWTIGMPINNNGPVIDNLSAILGCFRGCAVYTDNEFKLKYKDMNYESVCMALTEDDIVETGESSLQITQPSIFDTPNAVRIKYLDSEVKYQINDYILSDDTAIAADGDYREKEVEILGINSHENAQKMANYFLERFRVNKTSSVIAHNRAMSLEPLDLISLTHSFPGWDAKTFRVRNTHFLPNDLVQLDLIEEESNFYDDTYNLIDHNWHDTTLPDPSASPYSVINVSQSEEVYYYRNRSFTRWKIDFDRPSVDDYPWWAWAEIWIKVGASGTWKFQTTATTDFILDPVEEGETYYCKIRSVSIHGVKEDFDSAYTISKQIVGKTEVPSAMSAITAVASGDKVSVYGNEISDPDIQGYELRFGDAWVGGIFVAFNETPNFRLTGVRPGTFTFWCKPKDNAGNYAANAVSSTVTVFYPANYVDKNTWSWDYNGIGTHDNTEYVLYNGEDCLKCSHIGGVLTGTWTSPEYDLGSEKTVRVWGDFLTTFVSSATSWEGIFPGTTTWADKTDATTKWYELTAPNVAAILSAKIKWGVASGVYPNEADFFEILAPEFTARYIQVEITITDPQTDANLYIKRLNMKTAYWS